MNITLYINQLVFPVLLLGLFLTVFNFEDMLSKASKTAVDVGSNTQFKLNLERFYEVIAKDETVLSQLNEIGDRAEFIEQLVCWGVSKGYTFTDIEVMNSIAEHTCDTHGNYYCLPIGCFLLHS